VSDGWYTGTDFELAGIVAGAPTRYKASYNGVEFSVYATNVPGIGSHLEEQSMPLKRNTARGTFRF
jgi:hypothetical protein